MHTLGHNNLGPAKSEGLDEFILFWFASYNCVLSGVLHCQTFLSQNLQQRQAAGFSHLFYGLFGWFFLNVILEYHTQTHTAFKQQTAGCVC